MKTLFAAFALLALSSTAAAAENRFAGAFAHPRIPQRELASGTFEIKPNETTYIFVGGAPPLLSHETTVPADPAGQVVTTHSVTLTWLDGLNPAGTTYTAYRATGLCSGTPTFSKLATGITVLTYKDTTVTPGNYCYQVTATAGGIESGPSNSALAPVPSFAPNTLTLAVQ